MVIPNPQHTPKGGVAMRAFKGGGCCQVIDEALHLGAIGRDYHDSVSYTHLTLPTTPYV